MKIMTIISGVLVIFIMLLWVPVNSQGARGCDSQDEEQWGKIRAKLPSADYISIVILIDDLSKLKDKCDPKTRFSASVVQLLIQATFRQDELSGNHGRIQTYNAANSRRLIQR